MAYYHGGAPNLRIGMIVKPPSQTGADHSGNWGASGVHDPSKVYVTTCQTSAIMFASLHPSGNGRVWRVEPIGDLGEDPDCIEEGLSFTCGAARVTGRVRVKAKAMQKIRKGLMRSEGLM